MIVLSWSEIRKARKGHKRDTLRSSWGRLETQVFFCKGKAHFAPVSSVVIEKDVLLCSACTRIPSVNSEVVNSKKYKAVKPYEEYIVDFKVNRRPY